MRPALDDDVTNELGGMKHEWSSVATWGYDDRAAPEHDASAGFADPEPVKHVNELGRVESDDVVSYQPATSPTSTARPATVR